MAVASLYWINGTIRVGAADYATIADIDTSVVLQRDDELKGFMGSRIANTEYHTLKVIGKLIIEKAIMKGCILANLYGMTEDLGGTLDDGATASVNYTTTMAAGYDRPEVEILVSGIDDKTGKILEIAISKGVMTNNPEILLSKEEFTQATLEIEALGNNADATDTLFEVRFEA